VKFQTGENELELDESTYNLIICMLNAPNFSTHCWIVCKKFVKVNFERIL